MTFNRFHGLLLMLMSLVCLSTQIRPQCDEDFGDLWQPSWATKPRNDLRCQLGESCTKGQTFVSSEQYDACCKCTSCAVWEGSETGLFIEYVSVLGRSLVLPDQAPSDTKVYKVEHTDSEMTEIPSNLCNWDNETNLEERYPNEFANFNQFWKNIVKLNFRNNKIRKLPDLNCLPRLDELDLENNRLVYLSNTSFSELTNLRSVDFSRNFIQNMDPGILTSPDLNIFYADFSHNEITKLDVSNTMSLHPFCTIDFEANKITDLVNEVGFKLDIDKTYGPGFVNIKNNQFKKWPDFKELLFLDELSQLGKLFSFGFDFRGMPIICDCNLEPFMTLAKDIIETIWRDYLNVTCTEPEDLAGIPVYEVDPSLFTCQLPADSDCQTPECTCIDKPNEDTLYIDCSNSGLTQWPKIPHSKFSKFISLNVSGNQITTFENLPILPKLSMLDVSRNRLLDIDKNVAQLLENASYIDISDNPNLRQLPQTFQYHNVCSRNMKNLQISCDCEYLWIEQWLSSKHCDSYDHLFKCNIPEIGMKPALQFIELALDCYEVKKSYILETVTAAFILILILTGTLIYIFRYEILIIYLRLRHRRGNAVLPNYENDVILSFNDNDDSVREWVNKTLEPNLIKTGYRVFYPGRDVPFGAERNTVIIRKVATARNFLTILSDSYFEEPDVGMCPWTENEWKYGWNNFKQHKSKNIVLVNFDHVSSFDVSHSQIKAFLRVGCTVNFKNTKRNIMEEIYTKLGKPFKLQKQNNDKRDPEIAHVKYEQHLHQGTGDIHAQDNFLKKDQLGKHNYNTLELTEIETETADNNGDGTVIEEQTIWEIPTNKPLSRKTTVYSESKNMCHIYSPNNIKNFKCRKGNAGHKNNCELKRTPNIPVFKKSMKYTKAEGLMPNQPLTYDSENMVHEKMKNENTSL